jgi:hypothetical protein
MFEGETERRERERERERERFIKYWWKKREFIKYHMELNISKKETSGGCRKAG